MTTLTIQQGVGGYTGTIDTYIRASRPDTQYSTATSVYGDGADNSLLPIQGLLSFSDLFGDGPGQIPLGSTITSASLTLTMTDGTSSPVSFYRMTSDWMSLPSWTWNSFGNGIQTDGTEALATADVSLSGLSSGVRSVDVTASLQAWASGAENYGWLLTSASSDGFAFNSSEAIGAPILTITFEPPTAPSPGLVLLQSGGTTAVTEGGTGDTLLVSLRSAPTADVTLTVWTAGTYDVSLSPTVLIFTPENWQTQQSVALTALDDVLYEGPESFAGLVTASSTDAAYNGLSYDFTVGVTDNDPPPPPPGLDVFESGGKTAVTEGGTGDTLVISLHSAPTADVTLTVWTSGVDDVSLSPTVLTFTTANWQTQQTVTLGAIDDLLVEGLETFNGTVSATSADAAYDGLSYDFTVAVTSNDGTPLPTVLDPYLVAIRDTTQYKAGDPSSIKGSGDPSGIAYVPELDLLFIVDSEHDESPYFSPMNLFTAHLDGSFAGPVSLRAFTREPTGIAYNPLNGRLYITDDDARKIFIVDPHDPGTLISSIDLAPYKLNDAEDPAIDPVTGHIYLLDGVSRRLVELSETGSLISSTVLPTAIKDAEALAYDAERDVFYIASGATKGTIFQTDHDGHILATIDLLNDYRNPISGSSPKIKGLELAPSSDPNDGDRLSLYAVDYGKDQSLDGRIFEIDLYHGWLGV